MRLVLVAVLLCATPVLAEGEQEAGLLPYIDASGLVVGGGMTSGILLPDGDLFSRVCEEAFDPQQIPPTFSLPRTDGTVLIGSHLGLFTTSDKGCSFDHVAGPLEARSMGGVAVVADTLFTVTGDFSRANGVWISIDGGAQWSPALEEQAGISFQRIIASVDGTRLLVSGTHITGGTGPAIFASVDSGVTFNDVSSGYSDFPVVLASTFDTDDSGALFGGFDNEGHGLVLLAAPPYDAPARVGDLPSSVTHIAIHGDTRYALAQLAGKLFKEGPGDTAFVDISGDATPTNCLFAGADGAGLVGCGKKNALSGAGVFMSSTDGTTWTSSVGWDQIKYRKCPAGTIGNTACSRFIESVCTGGDDDDADGLTDCDDPDCGDNAVCGGSGEGEGEGDVAGGEGEGDVPPGQPGTCACAGTDGAAVAFALVAFVGLLRRRRR